MAMKINQDECTTCGACEAECPSDAISMQGAAYVIDAEKCTECEGVADAPQCATACPADAIVKA